MSRYIDADAFDERVRISVGLVEEELTDDYKDGVRCTLEMLKTQPTADVVEVVRCKDCRYYLHSNERCELIDIRSHFYETDNTWTEDAFCAWGKRKVLPKL